MYKLQFKDDAARSIWLVGERIRLGSSQDNDVVLSGLGIEDFHAEIEISGDQLRLSTEPGSCLVNELPVDSGHQLRANDELKIGSERLLITDPKQKGQQAKNSAEPCSAINIDEQSELTGWLLLPLHSKLKSQDFLITNNAVIGRGKDCVFSIPYKLLSREHAVFEQRGSDIFIKDLNSSNGTYVNGQRITEASLRHDDVLAFGKLRFKVQAPANEQPQQPFDANRTMVRPALDLNKLQAESATQLAIDFDTAVADEGADNEALALVEQPKAGMGKNLLAFCLLACSATVVWWFTNSG